jgi:hypothetical protein
MSVSIVIDDLGRGTWRGKTAIKFRVENRKRERKQGTTITISKHAKF